jgi:hypothetical protein
MTDELNTSENTPERNSAFSPHNSSFAKGAMSNELIFYKTPDGEQRIEASAPLGE